MPLRHGRRQPDQRMEHVVTVIVGLVWSGQHLEHNAQRQKAPTRSTRYSAITIEENFFLSLDKLIENGLILTETF